MTFGQFFERRKIEITIVSVVVTLISTSAVLKSRKYEPPYVAKLSSKDRDYCRSKANDSTHNVAYFGGGSAEYYVAIEDCVRRIEPDAFKR